MNFLFIAGIRDLAELQEYVNKGVVTFSPLSTQMDHIKLSYIDEANPDKNSGVELSIRRTEEKLPTGGEWEVFVDVEETIIVGWRFFLIRSLLALVGLIAGANSLEFYARNLK